MADVTENYRLKWHSFGSHLHSCIASAFNEETFADVSLYTMDGHRILAHRFVLSACSQYFYDILKVQQKMTTTLPLIIVLPPEINYKTMTTLIQYMYSGETTVSKEILKNVLRAADLLKMRGLWRSKEKRYYEIKIHEQDQDMSHNASHSTSSLPTADVTEEDSNINVNAEPSNSKQKEINKGEVSSSPKPVANFVVKVQEKDQSEAKNPHAPEVNKSKPSLEEGCEKADGFEKNPSTTMDNLQFSVIKEEPIEWRELEEGEMKMIEESKMLHSEMTIKPDVVLDDQEEEPEELYSPLTCELCAETFKLPAEWVRHIQTHPDMPPAKRQKRGKPSEDDTGTCLPLQCDVCQKYFPTPAEWVQHTQNSHTEFELHISNRASPVGPESVSLQLGFSDKVCTFCNKKFASHASMLMHMRTHTGKKPYMCAHCQKEFNLKSSLVRHLKTLHNRIINSTDGEYRDSTNSGST